MTDTHAANDESSVETNPSLRIRVPAVSIALTLACGIAVDRWLGISLIIWLVVGSVGLGCWLVGFLLGKSRARAALLLITCVAIGGMRHHLFWSTAPANDIANFADRVPRLVQLKGTIATAPYIIAPDENAGLTIPQSDRSICTIDCQSLSINGQQEPVSGTARLEVSGRVTHVKIGDVVEVVGWLSFPATSRNPGEFDFRDYLRREGIRTVVRSNYADSVRVENRGADWSLARIRSKIRADSEATRQKLPSAGCFRITGCRNMSRRRFRRLQMIQPRRGGCL